MSALDLLVNVAGKASRRLARLHAPFVRRARRRARVDEHCRFAADAVAVDRALARLARGTGPIVAGPWLAEVGYEVLYWRPFLRWFADAYAIRRDRLLVVSRGGMRPLYDDFAAGYVDLFDLMTPAELVARNTARRAETEGGGQKQSAAGEFDRTVAEMAAARAGAAGAAICHPSLMFRLFRHVWHGNLPWDLLWTHTRYERLQLDTRVAWPGQPANYSVVKVYGGPALPPGDASRDAVRSIVRNLAARGPVVTLDAPVRVDEHDDFDLSGIPGVVSASGLMRPEINLQVQLALIAGARRYVGTCGGLAWLAPMLGVPTVGLYSDDRLLAPHLYVARQITRATGAATFHALDVRVADLASAAAGGAVQ